LRWPCVNKAGADSLVCLSHYPTLEEELALAPQAAGALAIWQLRPGAILTVSAPDGSCFRARFLGDNRVKPFQALPDFKDGEMQFTVFQALPGKERFELILEKLTEIGVHRIVPMVTQRSATLADRDRPQKKSHRWPHILLAAAKQCRRPTIPELAPVTGWEEALQEAAGADQAFMLFEGATDLTLGQALTTKRPASVALLVGPEGGFAGEEVDQAGRAGIRQVSLGARILRTETAALAGAILVQHLLGRLG